jgi:dTDP-glucose pyrophosphorylase
MKPTLLILAAGLGSRYGGVKQMDGLGPAGESIIDYSVFDAIRAGFGKIVFVVNEKIRDDFIEIWEPKLKNKIDYSFVIQDPHDLPEGFSLPQNRVKPWGTGQAVLAARNEIDTLFAVINADDFYGAEAYRLCHDFLTEKSGPDHYCMIGYLLSKTLSEYGSVSRGVCIFDENEQLDRITEITAIERKNNKVGYEIGHHFLQLDEEARISMNFWGFKPGIFSHLGDAFASFLKQNIQDDKAEFLLPSLINDMVKTGQTKVSMLKTSFDWFGVTYKEDKAESIARINQMVKNGEYPLSL